MISGRGGRTRTAVLLVPNQARWPLRYAPTGTRDWSLLSSLNRNFRFGCGPDLDYGWLFQSVNKEFEVFDRDADMAGDETEV